MASYHTASGRYSVDEGYFAASVSNGPLTFLANGTDGGNGVYAYGAGGFPNQTFNASNYWVDVVFTTSGGGADTTPPLVAAVSPASGAVGVNAGTAVTATFNEGINAATLTTSTFLLRDASNSVVPATVSYSTSAVRATLTPTAPLAFSASYTATLKGGATDPRVKDLAGNALAADFTWSFTTAPPRRLRLPRDPAGRSW